MSSKSVPWSTFTNSVSQLLISSSDFCSLGAATWYLQYSMTFARMDDCTFGSGTGSAVPASADRSVAKLASVRLCQPYT